MQAPHGQPKRDLSQKTARGRGRSIFSDVSTYDDSLGVFSREHPGLLDAMRAARGKRPSATENHYFQNAGHPESPFGTQRARGQRKRRPSAAEKCNFRKAAQPESHLGLQRARPEEKGRAQQRSIISGARRILKVLSGGLSRNPRNAGRFGLKRPTGGHFLENHATRGFVPRRLLLVSLGNAGSVLGR